MMNLALSEILGAVSGKLLDPTIAMPSDNGPLRYSEIVFDSRNASPDSIFLCIPGEKVDGHDFAPQAIALGAKLIIGENEEKLAGFQKRFKTTHFLLVRNVLVALGRLAAFYRRRFSIPVIGLTGSSGKTTTKDLISSIFKATGKNTLVTEGTLNNHWGVPQMVMKMRDSHQAAVFEIGTSGFGEITHLSTICQPNIGYISTIGAGHLEMLKDKNGVLKAKRELFDWIELHGKNRVLLFNLDDPLLSKLHDEFKLRNSSKRSQLLTLSQDRTDADFSVVKREPLGFEHRYGWRYEFKAPHGSIEGSLPLPGAHNLFNALAASALALISGMARPAEIAAGLESPQISKLRSNLFKIGSGSVVYDDSYNSNPTSVAALFEAARLIRRNERSGISKTVAVVGDMLELGPNSRELHREMGRLAARDGISVLLATGSFAREWIEGYNEEKSGSGSSSFDSQDDLMIALEAEMKTNPRETLVLIKGSRGARMDKIAERLQAST